MPTFVASRWSGDDNAVFPDRLEIDSVNVTHFKGTIVGYHKIVIPRSTIASVRILSGLIFADVIIESFGGREIWAKGFTKRDARDAVSILS